MSYNKALKVGICLAAGAAAGFAVYKTVKVGFDRTEKLREIDKQRALSNVAVATADAQTGVFSPGNPGAAMGVTPQRALEIAQSNPALREETKGEIIHNGLNSAASACQVVHAAAQCVSGIADSVSRMSTMFNNDPNQAYYNNCCNNFNNFGGFNQPLNIGNGQTWYRTNPFIVDARPCNPSYQNFYNNYTF